MELSLFCNFWRDILEVTKPWFSRKILEFFSRNPYYCSGVSSLLEKEKTDLLRPMKFLSIRALLGTCLKTGVSFWWDCEFRTSVFPSLSLMPG